MPDSATSTRSPGHQRRQPAEGGRVDVEGLEVAGVDADQLGAEGDGPLGLRLVVHLDQHGQAELAGLVVQPVQVVVVERRDDQQRQVGTGRPGLEQLVAVDDEVLAQQRVCRPPRAPRAGRRGCRRSDAPR